MNYNNKWLEVVNLDKLVNFSRRLIFYNFDDEHKDIDDKDFLKKIENIKDSDSIEMDTILPFEEAKAILKSIIFSKRHKKTKKIKYFMRDSDYDDVLIQLNRRMVSNIVMGLVKKGVLESAFDDEKNDFVFWVKNLSDETD